MPLYHRHRKRGRGNPGRAVADTDADLRRLGISRAELQRYFADGAQLMRAHQPGERIRPVATERLDGIWEVHLVRYSARSDPLMDEKQKGKLH